MKYNLRPYQIKSVESGIEQIKRGKKSIIVAPTASGKSLIIANIAKGLSGKTIIFQPNKEILEQNLKKIYEYGFTDVGIFSASMGQKTIGQITLSTIGTIYNQKDLWTEFDNVIIDETHAVNAKDGMYQEFLSAHKGGLIGLTATPYRLHTFNNHQTGDKSAVVKFLTRTRPRIFDTIGHITQVKDLYNEGFLCPIQYKINDRYSQSEIKLNSTGADFDDVALQTYNSEMKVIDITLDRIKNSDRRHILVFNRFIGEAQALVNNLTQYGIVSAIVTAETKKDEREEILNGFKNGTIKVVANVGVLTTGFDFPELDCVILARPTQSVSLYQQMIGRGMRIADGKEYCEVYDVCGNVARFGRVETFEIVDNNGLHRLKSETQFLTGWDFVSNTDLENTLFTTKDTGNYITFGKHGQANGGKGTHIQDLPDSYLIWACENFKDGQWKIKFIDEFNRRKQLLLSRK